MRQWVRQPAEVAVVALIVFFSAAYIALGWHNYTHFMTGVDLAGYTQEVYNLSHGRLPLNTFKGFVMWGDHAHFIMVLVAPLYWLWPDARLLIIIQALAVTTAGWALYKLAMHILGHRFFALSLLYSYLAFVGLQFALDFDFHPSVLTAGALIWACYGFYAKKPRIFWAAFLLGLLTREDAAPIFFMLGLWWLTSRRWLTAGLTMGISAAYFLVVAYFVMPLWSPEGAALLYLDGNEKDVWSLVRGFFFYPKAILQNMFDTEQKVETALILFSSFSWLSLLSPLTYLGAAPIFYSRFNSSQDYRWLITNHSNANILPILAVGALLGVSNLRLLLHRLGYGKWERALYFGCSLALIFATHMTAWSHPTLPLKRLTQELRTPSSFSNSAAYPAFQELYNIIPPNDSVSGSSGVLAHLGHRERLYTYPTEDSPQWIVLLTEHGNPWPLNRDQAKSHLQRLQQEGAYEMVWSKEGIHLFKRRGN